MTSLRKNIFFSTILTAANYVFPLLTYPYVSRVLGVSNIGVCNFVDSIVNYFSILSMLGFSTVGIREISRCRSDRDKLKETFSKLFTLNTITTAIAVIALIISIYLVPKLYANKELMWIGVLKLISTYLTIDWLYKGLEEFKYITNRTILVKLLYVASVFIFIRSEHDTGIYYLLLTLMIAVNALINIIHSRKYIHFHIDVHNVSPLLKEVLTFGIYGILLSLYTTFNTVYLGFSCGDVQVGYYATGHKIFKIILSVFTAVTGVMMPRLSSLLSENRYAEFRRLLKKSLRLLLIFFTPVSVGIMIFAPEIIQIIAGPQYEGAIAPLRIMAPLILLIGIEQIIIIQGLTPMKQDKAILLSSIAGAVTGISLNILLVSKYGATGSAIAWFASECVVATFSSIFFFKNLRKTRLNQETV